jgi:release factor glutamine methyltransferase
LSPEVRAHDPLAALDGGGEGLDPYGAIFAQARRLLAPGGHVVVEFGAGQGDDVVRIAAGYDLACAERVCDLAEVERAAAFTVQTQSAAPLRRNPREI